MNTIFKIYIAFKERGKFAHHNNISYVEVFKNVCESEATEIYGNTLNLIPIDMPHKGRRPNGRYVFVYIAPREKRLNFSWKFVDKIHSNLNEALNRHGVCAWIMQKEFYYLAPRVGEDGKVIPDNFESRKKIRSALWDTYREFGKETFSNYIDDT